MERLELSRFRQGDDLEQVAGAFSRDGGVIVEDLIARELAQELSADCAPHLDAVPWCNRDYPIPVEGFGETTKRLHGLFGLSPKFYEIGGHPWLDAACKRILGAHCIDHRIAMTELIQIGPGEKAQPFHRDTDSWPSYPQPRPDFFVIVMVALTDFTDENGATVIAPGSHRWPADRKAREEECTRATMKRGSALVFNGAVLHGGGANGTSASRLGAYIGYTLGWLRPLEQHVLTSGIDAVCNAPPRLRTLLGYTDQGWSLMV